MKSVIKLNRKYNFHILSKAFVENCCILSIHTLYTHTKWFYVCKCAYVQKWMENSSTKCAIEMRNLKNFSIFHSLQYFHCNLNVYVYYCVWKAMFVSIYMKVIQMFYEPTYSHIYGKGYYFLFIASHMLYYKTKHQNQAFCIEN